MMFTLALTDARDRRVISEKVVAMMRKGAPGVMRLARNGARVASGRWEHAAPADWWRVALREARFCDVRVEVLDHEGGIATASCP